MFLFSSKFKYAFFKYHCNAFGLHFNSNFHLIIQLDEGTEHLPIGPGRPSAPGGPISPFKPSLPLIPGNPGKPLSPFSPAGPEVFQ